ncbi:MAG: hypothetical protein ACOCW2_00915 [Chitinivibrionales bacterium]
MRRVSVLAMYILVALVYGQSDTWFPNRDNTDLGGYVQEVPIVSINDSAAQYNNLVQSRFNTSYYPTMIITTTFEGRFLLYSGEFLDNPFLGGIGAIAGELAQDDQYLDLTAAWPALLYGTVDRAWAQVSLDKLSFRIGRQRINWGTNLVWNPNDWYNTFSPIDFTYTEGPGVDALRLVWYIGVVSVAELALEAGSSQEDRTFAALYKFNRFSYDIQAQAGFLANDAAVGLSWAGAVLDAGFRGEMAYFHPFFEDEELRVADTLGAFVCAFSTDYTFPNSLYLHAEALYNGFGSKDVLSRSAAVGGGFGGELLGSSGRITAKNLTPARFSLFGEASYQITPLLVSSASGIFNPDDYSFYVSPSVRYSVVTDLDLTLLAQVFGGDDDTEFGGYDPILAAIAQWSF